MILGIGNDLCPVARIEETLKKFEDRFVERCFSEEEQKQGKALPEQRQANYFAKRYAAKEACAKAFGTGIRDSIFLKDIIVQNDGLGKPEITLKDGALKQLEKITPKEYQAKIHLSLSDDNGIALAFVVIEAITKK